MLKLLPLSFLVLWGISGALGDGVEPTNGRKSEHQSSMDVKVDILRRYFELESFKFNASDLLVVAKYDEEVIQKMQTALDENLDMYDTFKLNKEINTLIYQLQVAQLPDANSCKPFKPEHEALLRALDLIVPDSDEDHEILAAKNELRRFYLLQPELAGELLERLEYLVKSEELHSVDAARLLRNYYLHWIPLGLLAATLEAKAAKQG